jgi:hypothetical protein
MRELHKIMPHNLAVRESRVINLAFLRDFIVSIIN